MSEDRWPRVKHLFEAAVDLSLSERSAFLSSAIVGDETLREEGEALLAASQADASISSRWPVASESLLAELRSVSQTASSAGTDTAPGLTSGSRLGNYDVLGPIGVGGMGEVYRAHDARLDRDVAIKILSRVFTMNPERL